MGYTSVDTSNALTRKAWAEKVFRETLPLSFFNASGMMGSDENSAIHVKTELEKDQGDKITFGLVSRLSGSGVTGDTTLKGNEEALSMYDDAVTLDQYRHGVVVKGRMTRKRTAFSVPDEAKAMLKQWGKEKIDRLCINALTATPSFVAYRDGSGVLSKTTTAATAKSALNATNSKINLGLFSYLRTLALTGNDRAFSPIRPINIKGKEYFVLLAYEDVLFDLKQDSSYLTAARECYERSDEHPLFRAGAAVYDQVIVMTHEFMPKAADAGAGGNVPWAQCVLMGAQSLCWAWGMRPAMEEEWDDYKNQQGFAQAMICGVKRPKFNSQDFGSMGVYLARTAVSG